MTNFGIVRLKLIRTDIKVIQNTDELLDKYEERIQGANAILKQVYKCDRRRQWHGYVR